MDVGSLYGHKMIEFYLSSQIFLVAYVTPSCKSLTSCYKIIYIFVYDPFKYVYVGSDHNVKVKFKQYIIHFLKKIYWSTYELHNDHVHQEAEKDCSGYGDIGCDTIMDVNVPAEIKALQVKEDRSVSAVGVGGTVVADVTHRGRRDLVKCPGSFALIVVVIQDHRGGSLICHAIRSEGRNCWAGFSPTKVLKIEHDLC